MSSHQNTKEPELSDQLEKGLQISSEEEEECLISRALFGGAIKLHIPSQWRDVSLVRQVPDHQECYQDCTFKDGTKRSLQGTGCCLVIEILAREENLKDEDAPTFFFRDLAEVNGGIVGDLDFQAVDTVGKEVPPDDGLQSQSGTITMPNLSKEVVVCSCAGVQSIAPLKNNTELEEGKAERVRVELCAVRLQAEETDILLTLTMPLEKKGVNDSECWKKQGDLFVRILRSFEVCDWSLFG